MPERFRGLLEHRTRVAYLPEGVRPHGAHLFGRDIPNPLAEFLEGGVGTLERFLAQRFLFGQAGGDAYALAQAIDFVDLFVDGAGDLQMKAVRAEVDGREGVGEFAVGHVV